jgi:hypothetical protein
VEEKLRGIEGIKSAKIELTFEPSLGKRNDERSSAGGIRVYVRLDKRR